MTVDGETSDVYSATHEAPFVHSNGAGLISTEKHVRVQ